ncbi:nicotinamide riboside transporter PnuC [Bacillus sp. CGMCC 1.16541]|uniref:nicotinamide riboside transporter PnuC n=1 Tax=Bacillus sp. CGMCC 1.16541 TaxID=2185143 RepID=UPI001EF48FE7|nr:nicotinamide riboside transporter PnuC [Bacillus sp. CGMCC 1.16541]
MKHVYTYSVLLAFIAFAIWTNSTTLEMLASLTGLICVWLNARENIWNYPVGFINVALFAYIFYEAKLYADMILQGFFAVLMVIGLYVWLTKRQGQKVRPTRKMTKAEVIGTIVFIPILGFAWGFALHQWTDASIPYIDATVAITSVVAQYFLSKKVLENWILWIAIDVVSIGMYVYKDLFMIAFTYVVFLMIAIYGWITWKREYKTVTEVSHNETWSSTR